MRHPTALILGASGQLNYGDEYIALEVARFYSRRGYRCVVNGFNANVVSGMFAAQDEAVWPIDFLWSHAPANTSFREAFDAGLLFFDNIADGSVRQLLAPMLGRIAVVHLHGGGYINSMWPRCGFLLGIGIAIQRSFRSKLVATGLGLKPLGAEDARTLAEIAGYFDLFECRDVPSAEALWTAGAGQVIAGVDDAFLGLANIAPEPEPPILHLIIQLAQMPKDQQQFVVDRLQVLLPLLDESYAKFRIWSFSPAHDASLIDALKEPWAPKLDVVPFWNLAREGLRAKLGDGAIVSRFHAHLLLARASVSGLYIRGPNLPEASEYYEVKHESLVAAGSGWSALEDLEPDMVVHALQRSVDPNFNAINQAKKAQVYRTLVERLASVGTLR